MADLSKIKIGDTLVVEWEVTGIDVMDPRGLVLATLLDRPDEYPPIQVSSHGLRWLSGEEVERAHHVPKSQAFKRGDVVMRRRDDASDNRHGLVLGSPDAYPELVRVDWPGLGTFTYLPADLELETSGD